MVKGRKPLPQELLDLRGTSRPSRRRAESVTGDKIAIADIRKCQVAGLRSASPRVKDIYWSTIRKVAALGMLEESFASQIFFYAVEYDLFLTLSEDIRKNGVVRTGKDKKGNTIAFMNPAVKAREKSYETLLKIGSNFGFSPVDKQRVHVQSEPEKPGDRIKRIFASIEYEDDEEVDEQ